MNLTTVLCKALSRVQKQSRAAYLEMYVSIRYDGEWSSWSEVDHFGIDDILYEKWRIV